MTEDDELWRLLFIRTWHANLPAKYSKSLHEEVNKGETTWKKLFIEHRHALVIDTLGGLTNFSIESIRKKQKSDGSDEGSSSGKGGALGFISKTFVGRMWGGRKESRILMVGLDAGGMLLFFFQSFRAYSLFPKARRLCCTS